MRNKETAATTEKIKSTKKVPKIRKGRISNMKKIKQKIRNKEKGCREKYREQINLIKKLKIRER